MTDFDSMLNGRIDVVWECIVDKWERIPLAARVSVAYILCSVIQNGISFITMPIFTRLLSIEQFGQVTIYNSWMSIFTILITLNLGYGSFSTAMVKFENEREGYIASVEEICILLSIVFLIIYLPFAEFWNQFIDLPTGMVLVMICEILASTGLLLWMGKKRFVFQYKAVVVITLVMSVISPVLQYIFVVNSNEKGYAKILGSTMITILFGLTFFVHSIVKGKKMIDKKKWMYALNFNVPLLAYYFSQIIFNQSDRIMISLIIGKSDAALYGVANSIGLLLVFVINAINNAYIPWYYDKLRNNRQEENQNVVNKIVIIMALLSLGVIWFAPEILLLIAGRKYIDAVYVVAPIAFSVLLLLYSQFFINVEFFYEKRSKLVFASIGAATLNIVLNAALIPCYGYIVAAYTTLFSYITFVFCNYYAMRRILIEQKKQDNSYDYKMLIIIISLFIFVGTCGVFLYPYRWIRMSILFLVLSIFVVNRKRIVKCFLKDINDSEGLL